LKSNAKVILRKETEVEQIYCEREEEPWRDSELLHSKPRKKIKSSESYINFEDVRLKVENQMREEVEAVSRTTRMLTRST